MARDIFKERERGFEADYFNRLDAKLIRKIRQRAHLDEVALALAEKLSVDDPALLQRVIGLGVTRETGPAFLVAPLVQVAWADGDVSGPKREVIFDLAAQRGIAPGTPAHGQLLAWLKMRPSADLFDAALDALRAGFAVLPAAEREARIRSVLDACVRVAEARGTVARVLSLPSATSAEGSAVLDDLERKLEMACPSVPDG